MIEAISTRKNQPDPSFAAKLNRKVRLDRIGSVTSPARLGGIVEISPTIPAEEGIVIVGKALGEHRSYGEMELPTGRKAKIVKGNLVAGALGARMALHGYMGHIPDRVEVGQVLAMLNMAGVMGVCPQPNKAMGPPIPIEIMGCIVRDGKPLNIKDYGLPPCAGLAKEGPPLVLVLGTCMNSGKTYAATETIRILSHGSKMHPPMRIAAGKLAGVAALRDTLAMGDNGAIETASFLNYGLPSTVLTKDLATVARSVIAHLEESDPDVIVLELGDGIIGGYNGRSVLEDDSIRERTACRILCANDIVGAWGGVKYLEDLKHVPEILSGPVTDNAVGTTYIENELKTHCANAMVDPEKLAGLVIEYVKPKVKGGKG
ncbi:MAG: hypothetical protein RLY93_19125 [Sumerlaeia bacterium]